MGDISFKKYTIAIYKNYIATSFPTVQCGKGKEMKILLWKNLTRAV